MCCVAACCAVQMAEFSVNAKVTGILQHTNYLEQWQQHRDVRYARPLVPVRHTRAARHTDSGPASTHSYLLSDGPLWHF